jgi:hypothetical protein
MIFPEKVLFLKKKRTDENARAFSCGKYGW